MGSPTAADRSTSTLPAGIAARAHRATDSLHSLVYFAADVDEELVGAGLRPGRMPYFASRSAPMGAVTAPVTAATFYNFNPALVAKYIPRAWTLVSPEDVLAARLRGVDRALRRLLGDAVSGPEVAELAELTRAACEPLTPEGRPLYAAHAGLPWPDELHLVLWHAATLLREYRGDAHLAALLTGQLSGIDAIVTHCATGLSFTEESARMLRGWSDEQWAHAKTRLAARGLMDGDALTDAGRDLRESIERHTDELDQAAWLQLGPDRTARVIELGKELTRRVVAQGAFPSGVFAQRRS